MIQVFGGQGEAEIKHTLHIVSSINIDFHASTMIKGGVCTCTCMYACMCVLLFHDATLPTGAVIMVRWWDLQSWQTLSYSDHISMVFNLLYSSQSSRIREPGFSWNSQDLCLWLKRLNRSKANQRKTNKNRSLKTNKQKPVSSRRD